MSSTDRNFPSKEGRKRSSRSRSPKQETKSMENEKYRERDSQKDGARSASDETSLQEDVILPMQEPYMQQIIEKKKKYEFRKYLLKPSVKRIWFYRTAPYSSIEYISEIAPAVTRKPGESPLDEDGLGNREFNTRHRDLAGYNFAYKILSVYQLEKPITLEALKTDHGIKIPPRGMLYTPQSLLDLVDWRTQKKLLGD